MKKVRARLLLLLLVLLISIVCFLPSFRHLYLALPTWMKSIVPNKGITLGLDLQGGIHMVLEVDEDRAVEIAVDRSVVAIQDLLVEKKIPAESVKRTSPTRIVIQFQNADLKAQIQKLLDEFPTFTEVDSAGSGEHDRLGAPRDGKQAHQRLCHQPGLGNDS